MIGITEHTTREESIYYYTELDVFSRTFVGRSIDSVRGGKLLIDELNMAVAKGIPRA